MSPRSLVVGAVGLGLVLRLAFGLGYWQGKPMTHDEREYLALASNLAAGRGFTRRPARRGDESVARSASPAAPATPRSSRSPSPETHACDPARCPRKFRRA